MGVIVRNCYPIGVSNKFVFCLPYVGERHRSLECHVRSILRRVRSILRRVRSILRRVRSILCRVRSILRRFRSILCHAFDHVNVVIVYNVHRAFAVLKDVLPANLLSKAVYSLECRQSDTWYVGRTLHYLNACIKQCVPLHCCHWRREVQDRREDVHRGFYASDLCATNTDTGHWTRRYVEVLS